LNLRLTVSTTPAAAGVSDTTFLLLLQKGNEVYILCVSEGREAKDRAIREKHELQLKQDLQALKTRIEKGHLKTTTKIHEAVGRLKER